MVSRAVQEGLTNARKHAPGAPVGLHLSSAAGGITVEMGNPTRGGRGLAGMRERAASVGGDLDVVRGNGEFRWVLHVPAAGERER